LHADKNSKVAKNIRKISFLVMLSSPLKVLI
jgi:hypothetical protein